MGAGREPRCGPQAGPAGRSPSQACLHLTLALGWSQLGASNHTVSPVRSWPFVPKRGFILSPSCVWSPSISARCGSQGQVSLSGRSRRGCVGVRGGLGRGWGRGSRSGACASPLGARPGRGAPTSGQRRPQGASVVLSAPARPQAAGQPFPGWCVCQLEHMPHATHAHLGSRLHACSTHTHTQKRTQAHNTHMHAHAHTHPRVHWAAL